MNNVGLIVTINKYKNYFSSIQTSIICTSLEDAKVELIKYIVAHFTPLNIDFPSNLADFENIWFNHTYVNANSFSYKIFEDGNWHEPWEHQEIYDDVLDVMLVHETANPPDFSKLYGEESGETEIPEDTTFTTGNMNNADMDIMETKMKEIMQQAKDNGLHKELSCNCSKCLEV